MDTHSWHRVVLGRTEAPEAVDVLCDAFFDYPVMTFVIGDVGTRYAESHRRLIDFFTMARFYREDLVLGLRDGDGKLMGVANLNRPNPGPTPTALVEYSERLWSELGLEARERYASYGRACEPFQMPQPHYHLGMIGVPRRAHGRGLGRAMLEWVHEISAKDRDSLGVSLTTEVERNVTLYQHFGYEVVGRGSLGDGTPSWSFWRPNP